MSAAGITAVATTAAAAPHTTAAARMSAAAPATIAPTSEDITTTSATGVKAVATTAAALRKCSKVSEGSLPEHNFLSREEIHLSVLLRNL